MSNPTVAVLFGGRSVEHEVSVISGHQAMDALDQAGYPILPIFITKQGDWYAGEGLHNLDLYREQTFHAAGLKNVYRVSLSPDRSVRQLVVHPGVGGGLLGGKTPSSGPTSSSPSCTAPTARMARFRGCSRWPTWPTWAPASWPLPWAWTRSAPSSC
jgi:hypothetical protein